MALIEENVVDVHVGLFLIRYRVMAVQNKMTVNGAIVENAWFIGWL